MTTPLFVTSRLAGLMSRCTMPAPWASASPVPTCVAISIASSSSNGPRAIRSLSVSGGSVTFAYCTGWRVNSEVLTLQWPQVDRKAGTVQLEPGTTKNGRGRLIKFHDLEELRGAVEDQWAIHEELRRDGIICPWVFPHTAPASKRGQRIKTYRRSWLSACKKAGIAGRIPHDFRRTAVRNLERAGVPRTVAMQISGHLTESVYRRYDIVSDADLTAAARQLNAAFVRGAG